MTSLRFVHRENLRYITGLGRDYAEVVDQAFGWLDKSSGGAVSEFMRTLKSPAGGTIHLVPGCLEIHWDRDAGSVGWDYKSYDDRSDPRMVAARDQGLARYGEGGSAFTLMIVLMKGGKRALVGHPMGPALRTSRDVSGRYQVYEHSFVHDDTGAVLEGLTYIGVTKRGWQTRWTEHQAAAQRGSRYRFHDAIRAWGDRATTVAHSVIAVGQSEQQAMALEEKMVGFESLYPRGLNMIPGGYAGLAYLRSIGAAGRNEPLTPDDKHDIINRFFEATARKGQPNPLAAALWQDPSYAERVICGPDDRLKPDQIRMARYLASMGSSPAEIAAQVGARNVPQVHRLLSGSTYSRIA